jgi:hypothetical protein
MSVDILAARPEYRCAPLRGRVRCDSGIMQGLLNVHSVSTKSGVLAILANHSIGDVSDASTNLMLDHANSNPFQRHYLGRQIAAGPYALIRVLEPQNALVQKSCSIGYSISKRRPVDLRPEQAASVNFHCRHSG